MRSSACCSARAAAGTGWVLKNAAISAERSAEQKAPSPLTIAGMPWKVPSLPASASQWVCTNAHVVAPLLPPRSGAMSVGTSCERTSSESANASVRCTSAGAWKVARALKNR